MTISPHTSMTYTKAIPMVIIALYLKDVYFGEVRIPFMLVKYIREFKENVTLIFYSIWF